MYQVVGADVPRHIWSVLTDVTTHAAGPIHVRHAPYLALGDVGGTQHPRSSIMYPSHLRRSILRSFGRPTDDLAASDAASVDDAKGKLIHDLACFDSLSIMRQAQVLSALNCLTEQLLVAEHVPDLPVLGPDADLAIASVWYEAARGLIRLGQQLEFAVDRLTELSEWAPAEVGVAAAIQLGAYHLRVSVDLAEAADALRRAEQLLATMTEDDASLLQQSRWRRLEALYHVRVRDFRRLSTSMDEAERLSRELLHRTSEPGAHPYERLLAVENHKIICEARLKAAAMTTDRPTFAAWAEEILLLDPEDPITWRCVSEGAPRVGMTELAYLSLVGEAAMGGQGFARSLSEVVATARPESELPNQHVAVEEQFPVLQVAHKQLLALWLR